MRLGIVAGALTALLACQASAGSVLIYDGRGNVDRAVRSSPSGFFVQDRRGSIDRAVRSSPSGFIVYDGRGDIDRAVRSSPSGFIVYDGEGDIVSAVRQFGFDRPLIVDSRTSGLRVIGTDLASGEVSGLRGGVGFE